MSPQQIEGMAREIEALSLEEMTGEEVADTRVALAALVASAGHALWMADRWLGEYLDAQTYPIPAECEREAASSGLTVDDMGHLFARMPL